MSKDARREPRSKAQGDSRGGILDAARRAIAEHGVRGMRLEGIAASAEVSVPLLYYHFESRAGLIRAVMSHLGEAAPSERLRHRDPTVPAYRAIRDALMAELEDDGVTRENALVWGEIGACAVFDPPLRDELARVNTAWSALVGEAIEDGIADGSVAEGVEPVPTADLLVALIDGLCTRWLSGSLELESAREALDAGLAATLRPPGHA